MLISSRRKKTSRGKTQLDGRKQSESGIEKLLKLGNEKEMDAVIVVEVEVEEVDSAVTLIADLHETRDQDQDHHLRDVGEMMTIIADHHPHAQPIPIYPAKTKMSTIDHQDAVARPHRVVHGHHRRGEDDVIHRPSLREVLHDNEDGTAAAIDHCRAIVIITTGTEDTEPTRSAADLLRQFVDAAHHHRGATVEAHPLAVAHHQ